MLSFKKSSTFWKHDALVTEALLTPLSVFAAFSCPWGAGSRHQVLWSPDVSCSLGNVDAIGRIENVTFVPRSLFLSSYPLFPSTFCDPSRACETLSVSKVG